MKVYDFSKRELTEMPLINESSNFEYILDNNLITQIEEIPQTCIKLSLSNNKISFINSKLLSNLQLKFLDLSFNRIISLIGFEKFKLLEELNLSNNYIGDDQLKYLSSLSKLKTLNISNNNLKNEEIKKIIYSINSLQKINISNNNIEQLIFNKSKGLIELELDYNKLNYLSFNSNDKSFEYLMYLSVNENKLKAIDNINNLINLEYLSLSVNELKTINLSKLTKLKYLQLKSNILEKFTINKSNQLLQYIDISFNNINSLTIMGECSSVKNLIADNNKLTGINFGENNNNINVNNNINNNKFKNIELFDISFNLINDIKFLIFFKSVQKLNISFNNIDNLIDLLSILKYFNQLKDLNLIENEFNKNIYNTDIINNSFFNDISDYLNSPNVNNMYKNQLNSYRSCIIININTIISLDNINITKEEKNLALKLSEYKLNSIDLKSSNFSIYTNSNKKMKNKYINISQEKMTNSYKNKRDLNNMSDFNNFIIESTLSKDGDTNKDNNNKIQNGNENDIDLDIQTNEKNYYLDYIKNSEDIKINDNYVDENNENLFLEEQDNFKLSTIKNKNIKNEKKFNYISKSPSIFQKSSDKENTSTNDIIKNSKLKTINNTNENDKTKIYKMLCETLYNLCDNKGYIYFKYFISLAEELVLEYNISPQLNEMTKEIQIIMKSSLLPGKFHIKDLLKIMQNKKYDTMYYTINQTLKKKPSSIISQSIHLSQCIKKRALKQEDDKQNYFNENYNENNDNNKYINYQLKLKQNQEYSKNNEIQTNNTNINANNNYIDYKNINYNHTNINTNSNIKINNNNKNYTDYKNRNRNRNSNINNNYYNEYSNTNKKKDFQILNTLKMKTPLLSTNNDNNNTNRETNENININISNTDDNNLNKGCFNILFQSCSELNKLPDLKNQLFLQNFIYFINHISFPIHFNETDQSFVIAISSQEKEYKFIQVFMNNFKMINFELNKWYCHNYYKQIFEDFESYEFLFEHSLLIFYSYYNEIIDNFFNDVYQIQDCYLMIEDNPLNLFQPNTNQDTRIVMLVLIQWANGNNNNENKQVESIVYNKNDNRYYFKNPFNWIGNCKNNCNKKSWNNGVNILVPVYIFSNIVFNNDDTSSFIKLYVNTNNKTF